MKFYFKNYILLTILSLILFLPGIAVIPMLDRDSAHFAQASKQMVETGNYFTIKFQNQPRHLKPPGIYWLQALSLKLFSPHDYFKVWPYRIPSVLGALFSVLILYSVTKKILDEKVAFTSAILLASCSLINIEVRQTVTDTVFLAANLLMFSGLWLLYIAHKRAQTSILPPLIKEIMNSFIFSKSFNENFSSYLLFWGGMSLGIFIKGVSPLLAIIALFGIVICDKELSFLKFIKPLYGFFFVLFVSLLWIIPFSLIGKSNFFLDMIKDDLIPKIISREQSHGMFFGYFSAIYMLMFWPSSLYFFDSLSFIKEKFNVVEFRFLIIISFSIWIFMEFLPTKLPEYILPIYPFCAVILSSYILNYFDKKTVIASLNKENPKDNKDNIQKSIKNLLKHKILMSNCSIYNNLIANKKIINLFLYMFGCFYKIIWILVSFGLMFLIFYLTFKEKLYYLFFLIIVLLFLTISHVYFYKIKKEKFTILTLYLSSVLTFFIIFHFIIPNLNSLWVTYHVKQLLQLEKIQLNDSQKLAVIGYQEPSLVFYVGEHNVQFFQPAVLNSDKLAYYHYVLINEKLATHSLVMAAKKLGEITGFNYNNGHFIKLELIYK